MLPQSANSAPLSALDQCPPSARLEPALGPPKATWRRRRPRIASSVLVLALAFVAFLGLSAVGYRAGRAVDSDLRFLEPRRAPTCDEALIAFPVEYALRSDEPNDVIFVGDSTCRCGVDPAYFERLSGLRAFNLGSLGSAGPKGFLITAKAYLLHHPQPRLIVLCLSPMAFGIGATEMGERIRSHMINRFEANYGPEVPGLVSPLESARYFAQRGSLSLWTANFFWTRARDPDVRDLPLIGLENATFRSLMRDKRTARGYDPLKGQHGTVLDLGGPEEPLRIHEEWDRSVRLLAEVCANAGVPLMIRFSPLPARLADAKDFSQIEDWSRELGSSYPKLTIDRPTLLWYDWDLCFDSRHVNSQGVAVFTALLAKDAKGVLNAGK